MAHIWYTTPQQGKGTGLKLRIKTYIDDISELGLHHGLPKTNVLPGHASAFITDAVLCFNTNQRHT